MLLKAELSALHWSSKEDHSAGLSGAKLVAPCKQCMLC